MGRRTKRSQMKGAWAQARAKKEVVNLDGARRQTMGQAGGRWKRGGRGG